MLIAGIMILLGRTSIVCLLHFMGGRDLVFGVKLWIISEINESLPCCVCVLEEEVSHAFHSNSVKCVNLRGENGRKLTISDWND